MMLKYFLLSALAVVSVSTSTASNILHTEVYGGACERTSQFRWTRSDSETSSNGVQIKCNKIVVTDFSDNKQLIQVVGGGGEFGFTIDKSRDISDRPRDDTVAYRVVRMFVLGSMYPAFRGECEITKNHLSCLALSETKGIVRALIVDATPLFSE